MKLAKGLLFLLVFLPMGSAMAQVSAVQHVIIIVQENRTPDNLFQDPNLVAQGADIWNPATPAACATGNVPLNVTRLDACFDPKHGHMLGFEASYDQNNGSWDNACTVQAGSYKCYMQGKFPDNYTYVDNTNPGGILSPYFQIAEQYGFANYMFQTNQGASFLAHQFLFSGTSAPVAYPADFYNYFGAEDQIRGVPRESGCVAVAGTVVEEVDPEGNESPGYNNGYPCYNHSSMADLLDGAGVTWKYYTSQDSNNIWTAPNALQAICPENPGGACKGGNGDWSKVDNTPGDILNDIQKCNLQHVSWVIPDGNWSDHPGTSGADGGPSWVAAIVNAVGQSQCGYWTNTTLLITWDDWGGFFDHVAPYLAAGNSYPEGGYPGGTGNGNWYVYGFRVPLLVVSAYAKPHYISGNKNTQGEVPPYIHDFGSILGYVESIFVPNAIATGGIAGAWPGGSNYPYADFFAPDGSNECLPPLDCPYPLSDFFNYAQVHPFTPITGAKYPPSCFTAPHSQGCFPDYPEDPDNDDIDPQE